MASTSTVAPEALHDLTHGHAAAPRSHPSASSNLQRPSTSSIDSNHLSPMLARVNSDSVSPSANPADTPVGSASTPGHYQSSDFSDLDEDPFFGANFNNLEGATPSFLDDQVGWSQSEWQSSSFSLNEANSPATLGHNVENGASFPLTPDQTASIHTTSPRSDQRTSFPPLGPDQQPDSISPHQLQKPFNSNHSVTEPSQLTPSQSSSCRSSEDGLVPVPGAMPCQSPRVTVSVWDKDSTEPVRTVERTFEDSPTTVRGGYFSAGDLISSNSDHNVASASRDSMGIWQRDPSTGQAGLDPKHRSSNEVASINEIVARKDVAERNSEVGEWLSHNLDDGSIPLEKSPEEINAIDQGRYDSTDNIPLGDNTENRYVPGQTYYAGNGGQMADEDFEIISSNRNWADAPVLHNIRMGMLGRHQPQSSQAAIEKFNRMCRDTDSILSRAATWGTRRRSLPSVIDLDLEEGVTSGNFLKKLSLSRGGGDKGNKQGSLLKDLRGLVRHPSVTGVNQLRKRARSGQGEALYQDRDNQQQQQQQEKRESTPHLSPTSRTSSWGKKPMPSINTALVSMGHNFASIGTSHSRSGSISGPHPTSPKNNLGKTLSVKNTLRRPRSKSELPKSSAAAASMESHPNLIDMWKKSGGPPVASLNQTAAAAADVDDEDDEDDEPYEDSDMKMNANVIDSIPATFAGFQQHVVTLNPGLDATCGYLVDRIAHQQIIRYKHLLTAKVKHINLGNHCPCGTLCIALGGSANILDQKGDAKGMDPLATQFDEDDGTPTEGVVNQESFPQDIPMPPTKYLPAEFECQLCYQRKTFHKPSDWTKHVHEDVQPFTCTWDKCREPKIFKRKADWVRHENEGHRHLEWWTCDVEDCRHTCYRRDNFIQHLVREHDFVEPKVKAKAAIKRAVGVDPTCHKVEQCHYETTKRPNEEPCRFCEKTFPTWKKLTVHLAKHMEQISLPVLRLVAVKAKELAADTIISPVQDLPPRHVIPLPTGQNANQAHYAGPPHQQVHPANQHMAYQGQGQGPYNMYGVMPQEQYQPQFYPTQYDNMEHNLRQAPMGMSGPPLSQGYNSNQQMHGLPATTAPFTQGPNAYMAMADTGMEPFPDLNPLGLHNSAGDGMGAQMGYDGMLDPSNANGSPFSGHESVSAYSHSPNLNTGHPDRTWDGNQMQGYM